MEKSIKEFEGMFGLELSEKERMIFMYAYNAGIRAASLSQGKPGAEKAPEKVPFSKSLSPKDVQIVFASFQDSDFESMKSFAGESFRVERSALIRFSIQSGESFVMEIYEKKGAWAPNAVKHLFEHPREALPCSCCGSEAAKHSQICGGFQTNIDGFFEALSAFPTVRMKAKLTLKKLIG